MSPRANPQHLPADFQFKQLTILQDTREQDPCQFVGCNVEIATLPTGDYSAKHLQQHIAIERKSEPDFLGWMSNDRDRAEANVQRLLGYETRALIIESTWERIEAGNWRSKVTPASALGTLLGWMARGLPVIMCGTHERCALYTSRIIFIAARRKYREARALAASVIDMEAAA